MPVFAIVTIPVILAILTFAPEAALAQGSDEWVKPAVGLIDLLKSGIVKIATGLIVVGVVVRGIFIVLSGNPDWQKVGMLILGAFLIGIGPTVFVALLEAAQSS